MAQSIIAVTQALTAWFHERGIDPPVVVRLPSKEAGMHFAHLIESEFALTIGATQWRPGASWVEIAGVRFVWPMPD